MLPSPEGVFANDTGWTVDPLSPFTPPELFMVTMPLYVLVNKKQKSERRKLIVGSEHARRIFLISASWRKRRLEGNTSLSQEFSKHSRVSVEPGAILQGAIHRAALLEVGAWRMIRIWTCRLERNGIPRGESSVMEDVDRVKYTVYTEN